MTPGIVHEEDLARAAGTLRSDGQVNRGQLKRWLGRNRVRYFVGSGGRLWTMTSALEAALGLEPGPHRPEQYSPGIFR